MCPAPCPNRAWRLEVTRLMGIRFWLLIGRKHFVDAAANQWEIKTCFLLLILQPCIM